MVFLIIFCQEKCYGKLFLPRSCFTKTANLLKRKQKNFASWSKFTASFSGYYGFPKTTRRTTKFQLANLVFKGAQCVVWALLKTSCCYHTEESNISICTCHRNRALRVERCKARRLNSALTCYMFMTDLIINFLNY